MKVYKIFSCLMASSLLLLAGCNNDNRYEYPSLPAEKVEEKEEKINSLEELNKIIGCSIIHPEGYRLSDESYSLITRGNLQMGEYTFTADYIEYTLRVGKTHEDLFYIIYGDYTLGQQADILGSDNAILSSEGEFVWSRWYDGDMQYSLFTTDPNVDKNMLRKLQSDVH